MAICERCVEVILEVEMSVTFCIGLILTIIFGIDILVFFIGSLKNVPTGFTEWVCYPFFPLWKKGCSMSLGIIIRFFEIIGIIIGVVLIMI